MHQKLGLIGFLLLSLPGMAQLANPSFEQTDSTGAIAGWQLLRGKTTRVSVEQFGILPFTAYEGNYFIKLESDTTPIRTALFTQTYAFADTPASFYLHHLYLPENTGQTAGIKLLMTKWNGSSRDTILYIHDSIHAVTNGNQVPIQWNTFGTTLHNRYTLAQLPDTATLELTNEMTATGTNIRWYVDDLSFGKWAVGITKLTTPAKLEVYPNPASDRIKIKEYTSGTLELLNMQGQHVYAPHETSSDGIYYIHTQSLPNGLYILHSPTDDSIRQLICIQH